MGSAIMTDSTNELDFLNDPSPAQPAPRRGLGLGGMVLLVGVLLVAAVFGLALARQNRTQPTAGPAPDFTLTTLDGNQMRLADLKGQVVVVNFWASWCGPCRDEAPALQSIWEKYQDRGVVVLGVAYTDTENGARAFMGEFGQTYPNGLDIGTKISELYAIQGVPETFIIDREGKVVEFIMQPITEASLTASIDRVLGAA
jgi:cytochrome c biogenesis protein CcmG, thiol:disulfide interchange protein DsbE